MVIHDFNLAWPRLTIWPLEADAPLLVDADEILTLAVASERFQPIASQATQRPEGNCCVQYRQPLDGLLLETLEITDELTFGK